MSIKPALVSLIAITATIASIAAPVPRARTRTARLTVDINRPGHVISPTLFGIFFEEINRGGDGGLYAELVQNRSFEESEQIAPWTLAKSGDAQGSASVEERPDPSVFNKRALKLQVDSAASGSVDLTNPGYWGMSVRSGEAFNLSIDARAEDAFDGPLTAQLETRQGVVLATASTDAITPDWTTQKLTLTSSATCPDARLVISASHAGTVWMDMVSLFSSDTFNGRPNGLRMDLARKLADLSPAFVRFPGGCWVEGDTMATSLRWKQTIGPIADRRTQYNLWQYQSGNGLGFHEYLQMSEDLKAEPLFVINCGMSHREVVPLSEMDEYVQDALDAIEYANGPVTTTWGAKRAAAGHPAPFNLKYMEIGNENGGTAYAERYPLFVKAIKARYPAMHLIADVWGGTPTSAPVEIVDEHYYSDPNFFAVNANKYDAYDRKGPKVYVGEYAVTQNGGAGNLAAALGEAAFMTGMERNSDIVVMASYAPLFANVNYKKWNPDLINFDSSRVYGTPSYYVQQMFNKNKGDVTLPVNLDSPTVTSGARTGAVGVGTWRTQAEFKNLHVTRNGKDIFTWTADKGTAGWKTRGGQWSLQDGAFRQMDLGENPHAIIGDPAWSDYTVSVKARKISGEEGFLVWVRVKDSNNWVRWNIGGWGNSRHALQSNGTEIPGSVRGSIVTGRWYNVRIEAKGDVFRCYLDGKLVQSATLPQAKTLYATASLKRAAKEVILKVVNVGEMACATSVRLNGAAGAKLRATGVVLTGASTAENTLAQPTHVAPKSISPAIAGPNFRYTFPARSVTVLRLTTGS